MYFSASEQPFLSQVNLLFIKWICTYLNIDTKITFSNQYTKNLSGKNERLIDICLQSDATVYFSGPTARNYLDEKMFHSNGIDVKYYNYSKHKSYEQLHGEFQEAVTILDLLFNEGTNASDFML